MDSFPRRHVWAALLAAGAFLASGGPPALGPDRQTYEDIALILRDKGLREEGAFQILEKITSLGSRPTGSPQADEAVRVVRREMQDMGLDKVRTEPAVVGRWVREEEEARLDSAVFGSSSLSVCAIGGSVSTPADGLEAAVLEVRSFEELHQKAGQAAGKIVFFNRPMDRARLDTFQSYGAAADQRVRGAIEAGSVGAAAVLVRSLTLRLDDFPHTGLMHYDSRYPSLPAACISTNDAERLSRLAARDPDLKVWLKLRNRRLDPVTSANVMGQITGTEKPSEIVLIGGHLDSWDLGTGAHDDGAGCAHALEALRLIKQLGLEPRRTIRAVIFMDEENGGTGGRAYARAENRRREAHLAAIESDRGGFLPRFFGLSASVDVYRRLRGWDYVFERLGMAGIHEGGGGVDIAPLAEGGTILSGLVTDSSRYFDFHHSGRDILEAVHPRELELGAVAMALFAYLLAQEGLVPD